MKPFGFELCFFGMGVILNVECTIPVEIQERILADIRVSKTGREDLTRTKTLIYT